MVYILFGAPGKTSRAGISKEGETENDKSYLLDRQCSFCLQHLHNIPKDNSLVLCPSLNIFDQICKVLGKSISPYNMTLADMSGKLCCFLQKRIPRDIRAVQMHLDSTFRPGNQRKTKNQKSNISRLHKKYTDMNQGRNMFQVCILGARNRTKDMKNLLGKRCMWSCQVHENNNLGNTEDSQPLDQPRNFLVCMASDSQNQLGSNNPPNMECRNQHCCYSKRCLLGKRRMRTYCQLKRYQAHTFQ